MQINDLIFKELIKRGYALEGKTRVWNIADSKLWYLTPEQAQAYLDLVEGEEYQQGILPKEWALLKNQAEDILEGTLKNKAVNLIDLGCGNGLKGKLFIDLLKNKIKIRYCPIDISGYMVEKAIANISKENVNEILTFQWNVSDFENLENISPLLRKGDFKKNFFLLLGNTFGNFETHEILYNIRSGMREGDSLLIGNGLNNGKIEEDIVKACRENKGFDNFLHLIPAQIGLDNESIKYDVRFRHSRIEFYYTILKDKKINFQNKSIIFNKGDQIIVAIAYHYKKEEFISFLKMYFRDVKMYFSKDNSYALALCQK
jgi:uncharacterized SAM-dependent methyltransferase